MRTAISPIRQSNPALHTHLPNLTHLFYLFLLLYVAPLPNWATGFRLPDQDAFATARGEAFVATADNPAAIYYNPAGLTQLKGHQLRLGVYGLYLRSRYQSPSTGQTYHNAKDRHAIPQLYYTYGPEALRWSFGLGVYAPFGLSSEWPEDTGFRTVATQGEVQYYTLNPVVACEVVPGRLSLGAGLTLNHAELDLRQGLVWPAQPLDLFAFQGDNWNVGYNLGLRWQVHEKVSIGISFRSATDIKLEGHTRVYNLAAFPPGVGMIPAFPEQRWRATADWPFPLKAIFGISWRPTPAWNLEFNADYTGWNRLKTVTLHQQGAIPGLIPADVLLPLHWQGSWYYEFGITRYFAGGWRASAGYIWNENSVPNATYSPLVADLNRHFWSIGLGRAVGRWTADVAYQLGYGPTHTVTGSRPSAIGQSADGRYRFLSHAVALSIGCAF
ncbi:MAG: outer membrane protein transport protein [Verrucomicrobiota bacterium]|nr:outer membrane protein transport protein [Verrucomicrobiota bacterium]